MREGIFLCCNNINFEKAKSFYETNNNLNVPYHYCDGDTKLGVWIATQRYGKRTKWHCKNFRGGIIPLDYQAKKKL